MMKIGEINRDEYEIYVFGTEQLLITIFDMASIVIIGMLFGEVLQSILFMLSFTSVRVYAGGYHASSRIKCYLQTVSVVVLVLAVIKYVPLNIFIVMGMALVSGVIILVLSPMDTENKRLDELEWHYYRKKAKNVLKVELFIAILFMVMHFAEGAECIVMALTVLAGALVGEKIRNDLF